MVLAPPRFALARQRDALLHNIATQVSIDKPLTHFLDCGTQGCIG